jgi:P-type E1-E2 ATPase
VVLSERLRAGAASVVEALQQQGCRCHILSGDPQPALREIGGLPVHANVSPQAKARYCVQLKERGGRVLFIGDGVNDVAAMESACAAIAIDTGSALATEFADGSLADGRLDPIPGAIHLARKLKQRLRGNLHFALTYNAVGVALAAAGLLHPVVAALLMVGSSLIVSLRGLRALQ